MSEQSRRPAGSPQGGEFAALTRSESPVELGADTGHGWGGSFHAAPTRFTTAQQVVTFFDEHPPPDTTVFRLRRLVLAQRQASSDQVYNADFADHIGAWDQRNPPPRATMRKRQVELEAEHAKRREAFITTLKQQMEVDDRYAYAAPDAYSSFQATVAMGRWQAALRLPPEERAKIEEMDSGWHYSDGTPLTHRDLMVGQRLGEVVERVMDAEAERNEVLTALAEIGRVVDLTAHAANQTAADVVDIRYYQDEDAGIH